MEHCADIFRTKRPLIQSLKKSSACRCMFMVLHIA